MYVPSLKKTIQLFKKAAKTDCGLDVSSNDDLVVPNDFQDLINKLVLNKVLESKYLGAYIIPELNP